MWKLQFQRSNRYDLTLLSLSPPRRLSHTYALELGIINKNKNENYKKTNDFQTFTCRAGALTNMLLLLLLLLLPPPQLDLYV